MSKSGKRLETFIWAGRSGQVQDQQFAQQWGCQSGCDVVSRLLISQPTLMSLVLCTFYQPEHVFHTLDLIDF